MGKKKTKENTEQIECHSTVRYQVDTRNGLSSAQVHEYIQNGWTNKTVKPPTKTVREIIRGNLFTYFNMVFAVLAVLLIIAGSFRSLTFLPIVLANLLIGIIQELRAKKVLDKLSVLSEPKVLVVRDGKRSEIRVEELVIDDIAIFQAGNQICADAILLNGEVSVNESLLTGEADEITKMPGDMLMSGSFIISGQCRARIDRLEKIPIFPN